MSLFVIKMASKKVRLSKTQRFIGLMGCDKHRKVRSILWGQIQVSFPEVKSNEQTSVFLLLYFLKHSK